MLSKYHIYDAVPFNKADSSHFQNMLTTAGNLGPGVKLPTSYEIQTRYLENEYTEMKRCVDTHRETWKIYGCTITCDGWTDPTKMSILNFMVYSKGSTVFLKSVDASHMKKNAQYIELLLDEIIQDVGPENVVQIVTDNASAFKKAGRELQKKYPLFWIPCAAHCIDLIFEDIGKKETVSTVVKWAQSVTNYIYNHGWVLAEMRSITKGDLIRPGKTRFATNHIAIDSILKKKSDLRKLFTSSAWNENAASMTRDGKRIEKRVLDGTFWDGMEAVHKIYKPLYEILLIVDTKIQPTMPILYDMFERVKQQISQMRGKKWVLKIINDRWDNILSQPLHAAAHFLNPNFHYRHDVGYSPRFTNSLATVVEQFNINGEIANTFVDDVTSY
ncbi:putative ribonuclease H-like domain-containing protein [Rosa chinensis]|uniref:Putative ribonuclease H-like domain-containing protein n=1 Tax=Rosa chinensis TaxID=74649 RepID=A0A2P6S4P9_ROSCH|nr:uncharacterized protein LOC112185226 [Rosa chinensis]PRQ53660.1 putative ribonuclease H-like domain-containing protein [Rosa chinensis]